MNKETQQKVALKVYEKYKLQDPMKKKNLEREVKILESIKFPSIISLIETIYSQRVVVLVMEYIGPWNLMKFLKSQ